MRKLKITLMMVLPLSLMFFYNNCSKAVKPSSSQDSSQTPQADQPRTNSDGTIVESPSDPLIGGGATVAGFGSMSVPTGDGLVARVSSVLGVSPAAGRFATSLNQVKGNLMKVSDPVKAVGFDSGQLLIYAACSDLVTGGANSLMNTRFGVNPATNLAGSQAALKAAAMKMLDGYTGGVASASSGLPAINASLDKLYTSLAGKTTTVAFMSHCMAASTAGAMMLGF